MEKTDVPFKGKKNVATEELSEGEIIFLMKSILSKMTCFLFCFVFSQHLCWAPFRSADATQKITNQC